MWSRRGWSSRSWRLSSDAAIRIVVIVFSICLVPILVLAWVFELTPEGLKLDKDVDRSQPYTSQTGKRIDRIIMVLLALGISFFAFDKFLLDPARDATREMAAEQRGRAQGLVQSYGDKSIAVLPFVDLSPAADQAYFSDGIAEELLNLLANIRELRVISRSSAFRYRGDDIHIPTVAEELNVAYVLEGSVRKAGDKLRITAQLIDARADAHVWSETYDRQLKNIFEIQDEISQAIVDELQIQLLGARPSADRTDPEAYALYLQALHLMQAENLDEAVVEELLEQVLVRDPDYVPALNLMVGAIFRLTGDREGSKYPFDEGIPLMRRYVDRALAIDPENSHANAHRGWMAFFFNNDLETAATYINRALEYDPTDPFTLHAAGVINRRMGRNEEAIAFGEAALLRDPLCSVCLYGVMMASMRSGQYEKALAAAERRMRVATGGWFTLGNIYLFMGDAQKALELYDNQKQNKIHWLSSRVVALHELGDTDARDAAFAELLQIDDRWAYLEAAKCHAWMGNIDEAFDWLDRYIDPESPEFAQEFTYVLWSPFLRNLRDDPRWLALREKANLGPERFAAIEIKLP
jgi:TolB-like protein